MRRDDLEHEDPSYLIKIRERVALKAKSTWELEISNSGRCFGAYPVQAMLHVNIR
jgi:hypothetical protein